MSDDTTTPDTQVRPDWREGWLHRATDELRPMFEQVGAKLPDVIHLSVGFGGSGAGKYERYVEGVTWHTSRDACGHNHVFISPTLGDTAHVLEVLVHELCHVADDNMSGHEGQFAEFMTRLGMTGRMTTAQADIPFMAELMTIAAALGEYPHGQLDMGPVTIDAPKVGPDGQRIKVGRPTSAPLPQRNRWLVFRCPTHKRPVRMSYTAGMEGAPFCGHRDEATGLPCLKEMER